MQRLDYWRIGNTPTHVGKTWPKRSCAAHLKKHPHARGEDGCWYTFTVVVLETPPRTWGRLIKAVQPLKEERNTPTHVGKTDSVELDLSQVLKHPHARGEDSAI